MNDENPTSSQLAERHAEAISDTGDGYTVRRASRNWWHIYCLWCEWSAATRTKTEAVAAYRDHEDEVLAPLRAQP